MRKLDRDDLERYLEQRFSPLAGIRYAETLKPHLVALVM